ncbi:delta(24)-sterol reductase-like [Paramacrobiotus metropolitanus]|uniref:delta(24)-sterol reductase-like n=1 Tax=Paramacrobiotus metropolitanus TaxID=2943436 RepID=UPI0024465254|nr:delta(24)-sterol reductase-like [Paramacrobiotus metropolitanus]XP_055327202.1 delta(24)-sterol reductase-like [Paramacrobiotus metropolitanus]XP_055327203.1 delta(24)-sterol reductase-like [Paramacrobiotus metropolitanus]XP_055327204.1 delta(24)-sterol reductase-like [Paramacrobiotus metropolitanus]
MIVYLLSAALAMISAGTYLLIRIRGFEHFVVHYRWVFVCLFLLPASILYNAFFLIRSKIIFALRSAPQNHELRVQEIQEQIRKWNRDGRRKPMCTARSGWLTMSFRTPLYKHSLNAVKIDLMDILEVDVQRRIVRVEPLVSMGQLMSALLPLGFTLPVVPELDDLTAGGMIMGVGVETSSHVHGLFQDLVESVELVLQDGSVKKCSKDSDPDLFLSVPWSHGTLGFLVSAELRIIPASKYVRLEYTPVYSLENLVETLTVKSMDRAGSHFVEGLVYSKESGVVMSGKFADVVEGGAQVNPIGYYWKPWFYKHVATFLERRAKGVEYIPLSHYYHRHNRSIFWTLENIIPFGNHPVFRYLFGWLVPPKVSFLKLTQGETIRKLYEEHQMIQDMLVPLQHLKTSLRFFSEEIKLYPLWLCPFWLKSQKGFVHPYKLDPSTDGEMYVDIGAYGEPKTDKFHFRTTTRMLEAFVRDHHGFQMLYADNYMTREEFRQMFDHTLYDEMRARLKCDGAFPDVYEKTNRSARL